MFFSQVAQTTFPGLTEIWAVIGDRLIWLVFLMLADLIFGVVKAVKNKEFEWERLTDVLYSGVVPIAIWIFTEVLAFIPAQYIPEGVQSFIPVGVWAVVFLKFISSIFASLQSLGVAPQRVYGFPNEEAKG